jgi:predicted GNAT superfamily acetyltransferase
MVEYRVIQEREEMEACTDMEILVWGMSERDAISAHNLRILIHTGGNVLGAFEDGRLIGCTVAFATNTGRLWSHIAAVHPDYQGRGIGFEMKHRQRQWALENGYRIMSWTFDPLMRQNAHFNLHLLGARTNQYRVNFYDTMDDAINRGLPSDRFEMFWFLDQPKMSYEHAPADAPLLLRVGNGEVPELLAAPESEWYRAEIPYNWVQLKQRDRALALTWLQTLREAMIPAFENGYWAVDFRNDREQKRCWYVLHRDH